jgi:EmrB/QacA subfamily drug resistance transporter
VLCAAQFMVILDAAIINVALADLQSDLELSQQNLQWVVNAYTLTLGSFLLLGGRASDLLGRWRIFVAGLIIFSLASLAGGFATSGILLMSARALQGVGGALISPAALSILIALFTDSEARNRALGIWGATAACGATSGVLLGGFLTNYFGWRSVLLINVPIGLVTAILSLRLKQRCSTAVRKAKDFDLAGAATITVGLVVLVYAIASTGGSRRNLVQIFGLFVLAVLLIALFVLIERRSRSPLVKLNLFRHRNLTGANLIALVHATGPLCALYFISLYLQQVLGYSALMTGLAFLPFSIIAAVTSLIASPLVPRLKLKAMIVGGLLSMALGLLLFAQIPVNGSFWRDVLPGSLFIGVGVTLAGIPMTIAALSAVSAQDSGLASGLINTSQQIGSTIVLALLVTISRTHTQVVSLPFGNSLDMQLIALTEGFRFAFLIGAALLMVGVFVAMLLIHGDGSHRSSKEHEAS